MSTDSSDPNTNTNINSNTHSDTPPPIIMDQQSDQQSDQPQQERQTSPAAVVAVPSSVHEDYGFSTDMTYSCTNSTSGRTTLVSAAAALTAEYEPNQAGYSSDEEGDDNYDNSYTHTPYMVAASVRRRQLNAIIPRRDQILNSGSILMRTKTGLFGKPFQEHYWVQYGRHCLLFFRKKADFETWVSDRTLSVEARKALIRLSIDFERDSVSKDILGYKGTCRYVKRYRGHGQLHVFKVFKWQTHGAVTVSSLVSHLAGSFASKNFEQIERLHKTALSMTRSNVRNIRLQHSLLQGSRSLFMMNKINQFDMMELHDEFADWLLQSKLEESGFIVSSSLRQKRDLSPTAHITASADP